MDNLKIGQLVKPVVFFKGVASEWPVGKLINIHKKRYEDGSSDTICFFVDMMYETDTPRVIRCCLVKPA